MLSLGLLFSLSLFLDCLCSILSQFSFPRAFSHGLLKCAELLTEKQGQESPSYLWKGYLQSHQMFMCQMHVVKVFEKLGVSSQLSPRKSQPLTLQ